jgi:hypothetical protein
MVRYLLAAAAVVALVSGPALAQDVDMGSKTVIHKSGPFGSHKKIIIKRHGDGMVSKKIIRREGFYGSSMPERRVIREREFYR